MQDPAGRTATVNLTVLIAGAEIGTTTGLLALLANPYSTDAGLPTLGDQPGERLLSGGSR